MKKNKHLICAIFSSLLLFPSCAFRGSEEPMMTQLQIREIQTRQIETSNIKLVMKSMMNVLQDEGFIIKNAVMDLGLLSAEKNIDVENTALKILLLSLNPDARWNKQQILEASANLSEFGEKTKIRINFQIKTLNNIGNLSSVVSIKDPAYYQDFFDKVHKGVFIQEQGI